MAQKQQRPALVTPTDAGNFESSERPQSNPAPIADQGPPTPADIIARFSERAAIAEYDGGLSRPEAEALAYREIMTEFGVDVANAVWRRAASNSHRMPVGFVSSGFLERPYP